MKNETSEGLLSKGDSARLLEICQELTTEVDKILRVGEEQGSPFDIHKAIALSGCVDKRHIAIIDDLLRIAAQLTKHADGQRKLPHGRDSLMDTQEGSDELLDLLTGTWLCLYFLGMPFVQIWEYVLFFADDSGFTKGASLCKAAGDVYRAARISRCENVASMRNDTDVLYVLDHNPLAVDHLIRKTKHRLLDWCATLGALYELLQLRLYLEVGGPLVFRVPQLSLARALKHYVIKYREEEVYVAGNLWRLLKRTFPDRHKAVQSALVIAEEDLSYMPGCVIGTKRGVYRTRVETHEPAIQSGSGRAGNFVPSRLLATYRDRIMHVSTATEPFDLLSETSESFERLCASLASQG
ncbi:hypothetical protein [Paraburkholderia flagellata]|uniref:hypothetical protein n=1 Tax=Paraburkholderia flagellata TaxID=2883241 RepID=UPI001F3AAC7B|nr:hypothetical protein [Paraburkholderia flagellata]